MTAALAIGLGLAVLASGALNASYVLQHVGAVDAPAVSFRRPVHTLRGLLRSRAWIAGLAVGLTGWALHTGALTLAPLSLVQAFGAAGVAFAAVAAVRIVGTRLGRSEKAAIALLVAALATLSLGAQASTAAAVPGMAMFAFIGVAVAAAAGLARLGRENGRAQLLGAAAGMLYGAADTATKAVTGMASHSGILTALVSPTAAAIVLLSAGAFFWFQRGLQTGSVLPVIALMSAATNLTAILGGLVVFGDALGPNGWIAALHLGAFALVGVAGWLLAPAQARVSAPAQAPEAR
jgi:hypothetical protein